MEQKAELLDAIFAYHNGEENELSFVVDLVFTPMREQFIKDMQKQEKICERNRLNIVKRWVTIENTTGISGIPKVTKNTTGITDVVTQPNEIKNYYEEAKLIPINKRNVTQHMLVCFYDL